MKLTLKSQNIYNNYCLIDNIYCFLIKNKILCNLKNISSILKENIFKIKFILQIFERICFPFLQLINDNQENNQVNNDLISLSFQSPYSGITKIQQKKRIEFINKCLIKFYQNKFSISQFDSNFIIDFDLLFPDLIFPYQQIHTNESFSIDNNNNNNDNNNSSNTISTIQDKIVEESVEKLPQILIDLKLTPRYLNQICHIEYKTARSPQYSNLIHPLHPIITETLLSDRNIEQLYKHQVDALNSLRYQSINPRHVIVSTSTASGKFLLILTFSILFIYSFFFSSSISI